MNKIKILLEKTSQLIDVITVQFPGILKPCYTDEELQKLGNEIATIVYDDKNIDTIKMPKELTAEIGAKSLFMGEFNESIHTECPDCFGNNEDEECELCGGTGEIRHLVPVTWSTIKKIYKLAVKEYGT